MSSAMTSIPNLEDEPEERRRLLNVLAQRRYRQRKKARLAELEAAVRTSPAFQDDDSTPLEQSHLYMPDNESEHLGALLEPGGQASDSGLSRTPTAMYSLEQSFDSALTSVQPEQSQAADFDNADAFDFELASGRMYASNLADYVISTPGLSVLRAKLQITRHLHGDDAMLDIWNPRAASPIFLGQYTNLSIPEFAPTALQKQVEHHPLLDALPWSSFRDRYLYIMTLPEQYRPKIARQDMASVTIELMMAVKDASGGVRVWGSNPFAIESWEVGAVFYSKFWWAIDMDIVRHSNKLRAIRGEAPLRLSEIEY